MPPLVGPRVSSYRQRQARNDLREPSSMRIIRRTLAVSRANFSFSMTSGSMLRCAAAFVEAHECEAEIVFGHVFSRSRK